MSFHVHARNVRDVNRPLASRRSSFASCIQLYCWLIRRGYRETLDRFSAAFGLADERLTNEGLMRAIDAMEKERRLFLDRLEVFARRRIREKLMGKRRPSPEAVERLYQPDFVVVGSRSIANDGPKAT